MIQHNLRDHFAALAMRTLLSEYKYKDAGFAGWESSLAHEVYQIADAMLQKRDRSTQSSCTEDEIRAAFEEWISASPYELPTDRFGELSARPGNYRRADVDLAWQAWREATMRDEN